ncbi:MAG: penicillin-binding protein 2 [Clostridiales bacterium]|uniref:peptidoglycan D,D-transpeptidase FtsI family protein n=1 Tax=Provencibacterium massiliense TaxID=1841868 RepID=UPI0009A6AFFF|nr:penicillin-binding protein 2 [Provencibacterium massiliense]PWM40180.1 MAG: penicillin-binding protein 2 [Clostridiales bacterium]RGB67314.1 penicillin-binding protein 2 [Harryflintia acetispora]
MYKRMTVLFCLMVAVAATLFFRLYYLTAGDSLSTAAKTQSSYTLDVVSERGTIYDRNLQPLTGNRERYIAAVMPCRQSLAALSQELSGQRREQMIESFSDNRPFLIEVDSPDIYAYGVDVFKSSERYSSPQLAAHIIGHLQDGKGAYGIERSYDEILSSCGSKVSISYAVDARKSPLAGVAPAISRNYSGEGVVLTLDKEIQQLVEEAAGYYIEKGAVVVMDIHTGDIVASASFPAFDPGDVSASMDAPGSPFVNRAFSAYNVGSTFKLLTAACALDSGISENLGYECKGYIEIDSVRFNCHKLTGHSWLTMQRAIEQSCNPYFINLGQKLDPARYLELCRAVGFSRSIRLAPQLSTSAGTLPSVEALQNHAELANFSFGQGALTASPVQIAQLICCIANGGSAVSPHLVAGATADGETLSQENPATAPVRVISQNTAQILQRMMVATVEEGSGQNAKPDIGSAGGKTASAQTGIFLENGSEIVHAWFSGFYPAKDPKYAIVVLNEGGNSGGAVAAPVFRQVANGIQRLGKLS